MTQRHRDPNPRRRRSSRLQSNPMVKAAYSLAVALLVLVGTTLGMRNDTPLVHAVGPTVTATLAVSPLGSQVPGATLTYTATITNTGPGDATGVQFDVPIDPNTTLVPGSVKASPNAIAHGYAAAGNTVLTVAVGNGLRNGVVDIDNITANAGILITGPSTTTDGGALSIATDGSFTYTPVVGHQNLTDTFTYTATDGDGLTSTGLATITLGARVWYVDSAYAGGGNDGSSAKPFTSFADIDGASGPDAVGDIIFVREAAGDYSGTLTLLNNQLLYGSGTTLTVGGVTINTAGANTTTTAAITLASGNTITGFDIHDTGTATKIAGTNFGTLTVSNVSLAGTGKALSLTNGTFSPSSAFTSVASTSSPTHGLVLDTVHGTVNLGPTTISSSTSQGIFITNSDVNATFGATTVSGNGAGTEGLRLEANTTGTRTFASYTSTTSGGRGIQITNGGATTFTGLTAITNAGGDGILVQNQASGATVAFANVSETGSAGRGVWLTSNVAAVSFADLSLAPASSHTAVEATDNTGTITTTSGTITAASAAAVLISHSTTSTPLAMVLTSVSSSSSPTNGISLTRATGTFTANGGSISGATGTDFDIQFGTAAVTYAGTISDTNGGRLVSVANATGGTKTFSGSVSDGTTASTGVSLTANTGATITFSGGLTLSTGSNAAFTATGGGTVNVCDENPCNPGATGVLVNTLTTTTGTALNVANTTIGANNLEFRSISSNGGANSGIVLNATGASGGLVVKGTGSAGSGGTINGKSAAGISLTSTKNVSLTDMNITNNSPQGITGTGVNGFSLSGATVSGNAGTGTAAIYLTDTTGAVSLVSDAVTGTNGVNGFGAEIRASSGSSAAITTLTVTGGSYSGSTQNGGFLIDLRGTASIGAAFFSGVTFSGNFSKGLQMQQNDNSVIGDSATAPLAGWGGGIPNGSVTVTGCTFTNNDMAASFEAGTGAAGASGSVYYRFVNNTTITGSTSHALNFVNGSDSGGGTYKAFISGNVIGNAGVPNSGSAIGEGMRVFLQGQQAATVTIVNNVIRSLGNGVNSFGARGIDVEALGRPVPNSGQTRLDIKIVGNDVDSGYSSFPPYAIYVGADAQGTGTSGSDVRAEIHGNTVPALDGCDTQCSSGTGMIFYETVSGATGTHTGTLFQTGAGGTVSNEIATTNTGTAGKTTSAVNGGSLTLTGTPPNTVALLASPVGGVVATPEPEGAAVADESAPVAMRDTAVDERVDPPVVAPGEKPIPKSRPSGVTARVEQPQVDDLVTEARLRWLASGLSLRQIRVLFGTSFDVADLPANYLGESAPGHVSISATASGSGWFVDFTPADDTEFGRVLSSTRLQTSPVELPAGHYDLLTALMHEMGHVLGIEDRYDTAHRDSVMYGYLVFGERRLPSPGEAHGYRAGTRTTTDLLGSPVTIGTLNTGSTVRVTFQVTINPSVSGGQVSHQGTVSGSNFTSVLTDDPNTVAANDATVTLVPQPDLTAAKVNTVSGSTPLSASWQWQTTVTNAGGAAATFTTGQVIFRDVLPSNGVAYSLLGTSNISGGVTGSIACAFNPANTIECSAAGGSVSIPGGGSFRVAVTATPSTPGDKINAAATCKADPDGHVNETNEANNTCAADTVNVVAPASIAKTFAPSSIAPNGTSTLTFTITNPAGNTVTQTALTFTDTFPTNVVAANPLTTTNTCGGSLQDAGGGVLAAGDAGIKLVGGTSAAGGATCTVSVVVTSALGGSYANTSGNISSTNGGIGNTASATLTVAIPPIAAKGFGVPTIPLNGITTLTISLTNPGGNAFSLSGLAFTDNLPAGLVIASPSNLNNACGGTATAAPGGGSVSLSGGTLAPNGNCSVTVSVQGTTAGQKDNSVTPTSGESGPGSAATASVTVVAPPTVAEAFGAASIPLNGSTSLTLTVTNPNTGTTLSGVAVSDTLPTGLVLSTPSGLGGTCVGNGTITAADGGSTVSIAGATLNANANCTIIVNVTGTTNGTKTNTTGATSSTEGGAGTTSNTATLDVLAPPTVAKVFVPSGIAVGATSSLNFTITNPAPNALALTGVALSDTLPVGLTIVDGSTSTCGGTLTRTAATRVIALTGATVASGVPCTFSVTVTGAVAGVYTNTTGAVSSTNGGTGLTASANLTVAAPNGGSKGFGAATIPLNGTTSLTITITNPNAAIAFTGVAFTDTLPSGLVVATPPNMTNGCNGSVTATAGSGSVSLSAGTIPASSQCSVVVDVTGTTAGLKNNTVTPTSNEAGAGAADNASLTVVAPPTVAKAFGAATIPLNGSTSLTLTIANPNGGTTLSGVAVSDTLPAGLTISTPNGIGGTCVGNGTITAVQATSLVSISGASLIANANCTIIVNVTGTTAGNQANTTGAPSSTNGGTGTASNTASLSVVAPPVIAKAFGVSNVPLNGSTTLTFTITNPAANTVALTGVAFTDTLPAGLVVSTPNGQLGPTGCGAASVTATPGSGTITFSGGTIAVGTPCTLKVDVTGTTNGVKSNSVQVSSTNGGTGNTANATLSVALPPSMTKAFGAASIPLNTATTLTFTLTNPAGNTGNLTGIAFTDTLPTGLVVSTPNALTGTCGGGTITATAGSSSVSLIGATLASGANCSFSVSVTGITAGAKANSVTPTSTESGPGVAATANLAVVAPPVVTKSFGAANIPLNTNTTLSFTVSAPAANSVSLSGVAFTDTLPAGLVVATPNGLGGTCSGVTAVAGSGTVSLTAATLAPGVSCTISLNVTGTTPGLKSNSVTPTSTNGGNGVAATASLTVIAPPALTKAFGVPAIVTGGTTSLTFSITNANTATTLTGIGFTDTIPAGLVIATPNGLTGSCGGGTIVATAGTNLVSLSGATLNASANCTFAVTVTGITVGAQNNTTSTVSSVEGGSGPVATASVTVMTPAQAAGALKAQVDTSGSINAGRLDTYLNSAAAYLNIGTPAMKAAACQQLNLFKSAVTVAMRSDPVAATNGASWIAQADLIRAAVPCLPPN